MDRREGRGRPPDLLRGSPGVMGRGARVRHDRPSLRFVQPTHPILGAVPCDVDGQSRTLPVRGVKAGHGIASHATGLRPSRLGVQSCGVCADVSHSRKHVVRPGLGMGRQSQCGGDGPVQCCDAGERVRFPQDAAGVPHRVSGPLIGHPAGIKAGHWLCVPVPLPEGPAGKPMRRRLEVNASPTISVVNGAPGRAGKGSARPGAFRLGGA